MSIFVVIKKCSEIHLNGAQWHKGVSCIRLCPHIQKQSVFSLDLLTVRSIYDIIVVMIVTFYIYRYTETVTTLM